MWLVCMASHNELQIQVMDKSHDSFFFTFMKRNNHFIKQSNLTIVISKIKNFGSVGQIR